ncbi:MAG: sulfotransferase [Deltaproteobacteria bacterium]|nr:sulfotransferase [Deltaproteobacteria bacterium]
MVDPKKPKEVRFTDIANPKLSWQQKLALRLGKGQKISFTQAAVLGAASRRTGLDDFGPDDFRERLQILLDEYEGDAGLTAIQRQILFSNLVRYASNRLLIEDVLKKHPEIHEIEIKKPIIVVGLPRSGTTHLLNLLAADQRFRSLPLWESYEPLHVPGKESFGALRKVLIRLLDGLRSLRERDFSPSPLQFDPRYRRCDFEWKMMQVMAPHIAAMHPMNPDHIHEELELMGPDISSYIFEWTSMTPNYRDHYFQTDQTPHYEYMKTVLKILQWQKGPDRWVLKCPQHLEQLPVLKKTFPDATFVVTHRDPVAVIQSAVTMMGYSQRMGRRKVETQKLVTYWTDRIEHLLQASIRDRHVLPDEQSIDVLFHEFMADDIGSIEKIYQKAGVDLTVEARAQFDAFIRDHPRGKHGRVIYDLKGNFGVDPKSLQNRFDFYYDQFAVRKEH